MGLMFQTGRLNTLVHIWSIRDMNHFSEGIAGLKKPPDFPELFPILCESVVDERVSFAEDASYA